MSNQATVSNLQKRLFGLQNEYAALKEIRKSAFMAAPPMPQGPPPPMDPAMAQGGAPPMGGMPPVDPATGMPMDPAMMGGAPPMDPAMGGMPPVDPATGMPMDPAAAGGAPPEAPAITPEIVDQILGLLEEMGQGMEAMKQQLTQLQQGTESALQEMGDQLMELDKAVASNAGAAIEAAPQKAQAW